jgi:voltage-gated potassium channel
MDKPGIPVGLCLRRQVHEILEPDHGNSWSGYAVNIFIILLIVANVVAFIIETDTAMFLQYEDFFIRFEIFSIGAFTVEYFLRLWSCVEDTQYQDPVTGRLRWMASFYAVVDFLAFAPFYIPLAVPVDLRVLRILRLFRIFRVLKLGRYSSSFLLMKKILFEKKSDLLVTLFILCIILILASTGMYYAENTVQPEKFGSIPASMWYTVVTLSTVGYGDVYPITLAGKVLASLIAIIGIAFFALPAGIITSGYIEALRDMPKAGTMQDTDREGDGHESYREFVCEHCGKITRIKER